MKKNELRDAVLASAYELTGNKYLKKDGEMMIDALIMTLEKALVNGEDVELRGFGKFKTVLSPARTISAIDGKQYDIPAHNIVRFTPAARLKRNVAQGIIRDE